MRTLLALLALLLPLVATGCGTWQANNASQAVDVNWGNLGSGNSVFTPASGGDDMRSRR